MMFAWSRQESQTSLKFGDAEEHVLVVRYSHAVRLLRIMIDGMLVYRRCDLLPWRRRRAESFRSTGPSTHFFVVQPQAIASGGTAMECAYRLWLDGKPVLDVPPE